VGTTGIRKLLAATDGSEAGEHAVRVAEAIAREAGAEFEVLGVETAGLPAFASVGEPVARTESSRRITWVRGIPGVEIVRRAEEYGADLVVLGRRERPPQGFLGSGRTADGVVRRRGGACLLVPPTVGKLDRMVIALDGTRRGLGILEPAAALAAAVRGQVTAVCVVPDHGPDGAESPEGCASRVGEALGQYPALGGPGILRCRKGRPVPEIMAQLEETGANLLVLGVRRGGPSGEMGSGHVGQDLLREAPVAILTVPI